MTGYNMSWRCHNCGAALAHWTTACPNCGSDMVANTFIELEDVLQAALYVAKGFALGIVLGNGSVAAHVGHAHYTHRYHIHQPKERENV